MNKLLEVHEFELITCNSDYKDDASLKYLDEEIFSELEDFILAFGEGSQPEAMDFLKVGIKRNVGKVIQARNYVGLIQMKSGFQIQILPKISCSELEDAKRTFLRMLRSMKDFPGKAFNDSDIKVDRMNLYEIFINMYIQDVHKVVKSGIHSAYLKIEDNLGYYKGKLLVREHINKNHVHSERFYVRYDEFGVNRPENRLIKSTLLKLQKASNSHKNIKEIRQLLTSFAKVEPSTNYLKDFSRAAIDRTTIDYRSLMHWSKVFLMNQSFTAFSGNTKARALLFPMEKVFEAYVAQNLRKAVSDLDWELSAQDKGYYLFDSPKQFALRPDIVITRNDGSRVVLDTKWKSLVSSPLKNYGISQGDMYQAYAYAKKYRTPEIWLLYPRNEEINKSSRIKFESDDDVVVSLFFVDIARVEESIEELKERLRREEKYYAE